MATGELSRILYLMDYWMGFLGLRRYQESRRLSYCWTLFCNLCLMFSLQWSSYFDASEFMSFEWDHFKVEQPSELAQWILSHVKNHKLHIKVQTANRLARSCKNLVATVYAKAKVYALHLKPLNLAFVILSSSSPPFVFFKAILTQ